MKQNQTQPRKNAKLPFEGKASQLKASLRARAAQFDHETKTILGSISALKENFSAAKHAPLEFGARAVLAVLQEVPTGVSLPFWMRALRAIGREIGTGDRRE